MGKKDEKGTRKKRGKGKKESKSKEKKSSNKKKNSSARPKTPGVPQSLQSMRNFLQLGSELSAFLNTPEIGKRSFTVNYNQDSDSLEVKLTYAKYKTDQKDNFIGFEPLQEVTDKEWLVLKRGLIVPKEDKNLAEFLLNVSNRIPSLRSVCLKHDDIKSSNKENRLVRTIKSHLSPMERILVQLTETEFAAVDSTKFAEVNSEYSKMIKDTYKPISRDQVIKNLLQEKDGYINPPVAYGASHSKKEVLDKITKDMQKTAQQMLNYFNDSILATSSTEE